ncbi:MAG: TlpA disulfide reductase family protein [Anaerolineales bacterium]|jgi:peroxiredoxin
MNIRQPALMLIGIGLLVLALAAGLAIYSPSGSATPQESADDEAKACSPPANVSFPAPDLALSDLEGNLIHLKDLQGEVVVLNAWATWCPPCRAEMPDLEAFHQAYQDQGLRLVGINIGERLEQVQAFVQSRQISFQIWLDPDESSLRAFNTISLPSTFVIDRSGQVRLIWSGMTCFDQLESNVAPLLLDL